jgi:hypothetical protein
VSFLGQSKDWLAANESSFSLGRGGSKALTVSVAVPSSAFPAIYANRLIAQSDDDYAEASLNVRVEGVVCGDVAKDVSEECDTRTPYTFPDRNNPHCPNPAGGVQCDAIGRRYLSHDMFGDCVAGCRCHQDAPSWIGCGEGCDDPVYCNNCAHCFDGAENCGETLVDGGGACPICDGIDDLAEGFTCALGATEACGTSDCAGTRTCAANGTRCQWSACTTYQRKCQTSKCCTCDGAKENPSPTFNGSSSGDCTPAYDQTSCGSPQACDGGRYRGECVGLDACAPDWDQSAWPLIRNTSACAGRQCGIPEGTCYRTAYPCHGRATVRSCSDAGACVEAAGEDFSPCANISGCVPPQAAILHKLDVNSFSDYVDAPASHTGWAGGYPRYIGNGHCALDCPEPGSGPGGTPIAQYTFTDIYYTDPGAYYPYRNGTLRIYGKASQVDLECFRHGGGSCQESCNWGFCGGNKVRIGNDQGNYFEYPGPVWSGMGWQRATIDLGAPLRVVGRPDWNGTIGFLQMRYVAGSHCGADYAPCQMYEDIITLER